ncbi:MAG TPA: TIGR01244 family sulfur transferase [Geminicoccaceae bacterium]|nr:TIGR01244 family sulfur transferase [Geminicoccus sp.]HMU50713.1 TIGR01244 family sulfur transferase [Geminicoccaceae bacterium]
MSQGRFRRVAPDFWVSPQLSAGDFAAARAMGVRTVINNRPDGEAADQLPSAEAEAAAREAGLDYVFVPVPSGGMQPGHLQAFRQAVDRYEGPFLAYCRSGTRSCHLWAFSTARTQPAEAVIEAAAAAGYDLSAAAPMLERIAAENAGR